MGVEFRNRTFGVGDELDKFSRGVARLAFGDVGRNRNRGATHLRDEAEFLIGGKVLGKQVDFIGKIHALLPDDEITIASSFRILALVTRHKSHVTRFYLSDQIEPSP